MSRSMTGGRKLTLDELHAEARERFGADTLAWAFQCPNCGDIATVAEFPEAERALGPGQVCIGRVLDYPARKTDDRGRYVGARGCNWVAYGLICGPWQVRYTDGSGNERVMYSFPLAPAGTSEGTGERDGVIKMVAAEAEETRHGA